MDNQTSEHHVKNSKTKLFCIIPFVFSLVAVIAAAYSVFQNNICINKVTTINRDTNKDYMRLADLESKFIILGEFQTGMQTQITDLVHRINITNDFHANIELITKQALDTLELANIEANWGKNLSSCLILLNRAEKRLQTLQKDSIQPVIDSIHKAAEQIRSYLTADMASTLQKINQLQNELLMMQSAPQKPITTETKAQESTNLLKKLVVVRLNGPDSKLNNSLKQEIVINKLLLDLQAANLGLIQNNYQIYTGSLTQALQHIQIAFSKDTSQLQHFTSIINQLELYKLIDKLPSLNEPIDLLKAWMAKNNNAVHSNAPSEPINGNQTAPSTSNNTNVPPAS